MSLSSRICESTLTDLQRPTNLKEQIQALEEQLKKQSGDFQDCFHNTFVFCIIFHGQSRSG
jgi:hypothetical protein